MKRNIVLVALIGAMSFSVVLTGCGGSKNGSTAQNEEEAMAEISQHIQDEAAEQGIDVQEELQNDYETFQQEQSAEAAEKLSKKEIRAKYDDDVAAALETYKTSTDAAEIREAGNTYNTLLDEEMSALAAIDFNAYHGGIMTGTIECLAQIFENRHADYTMGLSCIEVDTEKDAYTQEEGSFVSNHPYVDAVNDFYTLYVNTEEVGKFGVNSVTDALLVKSDGSELKFENLYDYFTIPADASEQYHQVDLSDYSMTYVTFYENNGSIYAVFDISGSTPELVETAAFEDYDYTKYYPEDSSVAIRTMSFEENTDEAIHETFLWAIN